ncbi:hypothetical protein [uncultured Cloacibacillus sp.]|uniref:hypothetical protein n=1 Tax=uncultured Cloacibacillus sp. TaxID=889794 RepID=UPI00320A41A1
MAVKQQILRKPNAFVFERREDLIGLLCGNIFIPEQIIPVVRNIDLIQRAGMYFVMRESFIKPFYRFWGQPFCFASFIVLTGLPWYRKRV